MEKVIVYRIFVLPLLVFMLAIASSSSAIAQEEDKANQAKESFNLAIEAIQKGDTADAMSYYKAAITLDDKFADAYLNMGSLLFAGGQFADAAINFKKVTEIDPQSAVGFSNLGKAEYQMNKVADAETAFNGAIAADPEYIEAYKELGKLYYFKMAKGDREAKKKAFATSADFLKKYIKRDSSDAYAYHLAGMALRGAGEDREAITYLTRAVELDPNDDNSLNALGSIYNQMGSYTKAIDYYKRTIQLKPNNWKAAYNLAICVQQSDPENYDGAIAAWNDFLKVARKNPKARDRIAPTEKLIAELKEAKASKQ